MKTHILSAIAAIGLLGCAPAMAQNQPTCGPRSDITQALKEKYGEQAEWAGLQDQNGAFELWINAETDTWTITRTQPDGRTCVMAVGENSTGFERQNKDPVS